MNYTVLVIDDDEPIHFMTKSLLGKEFSLVHARNAQEAIDILSNTTVNLILSDIHMPGLSGLELLESLREDDEKKKIPILIMTNLPTVEKEKKALDLGASDFIKKELFTKNTDRILELVRMKLVTNIEIKNLEESLTKSKDKLVMSLMESALSGSFETTVDVLCSEISLILESDFMGFWIVKGGEAKLIKNYGDVVPNEEDANAFHQEDSFKHLKETKTPYFINHIYNEDLGFLLDYSKENKLSAEISTPLYSVNERSLLMNNMKVPTDSEMFAVLVIKRSVLFSSTEFELVSRIITQTGSILWRLYKKSLA